jgi:guanylate kinase
LGSNTQTQKGKIIVVSAPSGAGKTTLLNYIRAQIPDLVYSVSATTRPPRPHETNGIHYYFYSLEEFKARIAANEFAEWQLVHGNYYGTPRSNIDQTIDRGRHLIMDIDVYGKKKLDLLYPNTIGILLLPPSMEILEQRLRERGTESETALKTRLKNATDETAFAREQGTYAYIIVNDILEHAQAELLAIMLKIIAR